MKRVSALILLIVSPLAQANVIQYFSGIAYNNPAELAGIKKYEFLIGATGFSTHGRFQGRQLNFNTFQYDYGLAYTKTHSLLPYGRFAKRASQNLVLGVDVTEPFHSNLNWGNNAITRYAATQTYLTDVNISPRLAYQVSPTFQVGAGIDFNFLKNNQANWALPVNFVNYGNMVNSTSGFGVGFNLGFYYIINPTNFVGLVYYSKIKQNTRGYSQLTNTINNDLIFNFSMPATAVASYVHLFSPTWLTRLQIFYSEWDANQYANFYNTAAPPPLPPHFSFSMHFRPSLALLGALHHQFNDKFGATLLGMIDDGPERHELRTLNFPADTQYFLGIVGSYLVMENTNIDLVIGRGFSHTRMQNTVKIGSEFLPFTTGNVNLFANIIDLKLKIKV